MTKYLLVYCLSILSFPMERTPLGHFVYRNKYDHFSLELKKDSTFVQVNGSCTWGYTAKGKWSVYADTITLEPEKIYSQHGRRRKKIVAKSSYLYDKFYKMNRVCIKKDTLELLYKYVDLNSIRKIRMIKVK